MKPVPTNAMTMPHIVTVGALITTPLLGGATLAAFNGLIDVNWIWPGIGLAALVFLCIGALALGDLMVLPPSRSGPAK